MSVVFRVLREKGLISFLSSYCEFVAQTFFHTLYGTHHAIKSLRYYTTKVTKGSPQTLYSIHSIRQTKRYDQNTCELTLSHCQHRHPNG